eukprot:Ihof_evm15s8 gene=Ihof_evmTU15s8
MHSSQDSSNPKGGRSKKYLTITKQSKHKERNKSAPLVRICVLGDKKVGKTGLVTRFVEGAFVETYEPTSLGTKTKRVMASGKEFEVEITDTPDYNVFKNTIGGLERQTYLTNDGFMLVYSVNDRESFNLALEARKRILTFRQDCPMMLVGTQADDMSKRSREIPAEEAKGCLEGNDLLSFVETTSIRPTRNTHFLDLITSISNFGDYEKFNLDDGGDMKKTRGRGPKTYPANAPQISLSNSPSPTRISLISKGSSEAEIDTDKPPRSPSLYSPSHYESTVVCMDPVFDVLHSRIPKIPGSPTSTRSKAASTGGIPSAGRDQKNFMGMFRKEKKVSTQSTVQLNLQNIISINGPNLLAVPPQEDYIIISQNQSAPPTPTITTVATQSFININDSTLYLRRSMNSAGGVKGGRTRKKFPDPEETPMEEEVQPSSSEKDVEADIKQLALNPTSPPSQSSKSKDSTSNSNSTPPITLTAPPPISTSTPPILTAPPVCPPRNYQVSTLEKSNSLPSAFEKDDGDDTITPITAKSNNNTSVSPVPAVPQPLPEKMQKMEIPPKISRHPVPKPRPGAENVLQAPSRPPPMPINVVVEIMRPSRPPPTPVNGSEAGFSGNTPSRTPPVPPGFANPRISMDSPPL